MFSFPRWVQVASSRIPSPAAHAIVACLTAWRSRWRTPGGAGGPGGARSRPPPAPGPRDGGAPAGPGGADPRLIRAVGEAGAGELAVELGEQEQPLGRLGAPKLLDRIG